MGDSLFITNGLARYADRHFGQIIIDEISLTVTQGGNTQQPTGIKLCSGH